MVNEEQMREQKERCFDKLDLLIKQVQSMGRESVHQHPKAFEVYGSFYYVTRDFLVALSSQVTALSTYCHVLETREGYRPPQLLPYKKVLQTLIAILYEDSGMGAGEVVGGYAHSDLYYNELLDYFTQEDLDRKDLGLSMLTAGFIVREDVTQLVWWGGPLLVQVIEDFALRVMDFLEYGLPERSDYITIHRAIEQGHADQTQDLLSRHEIILTEYDQRFYLLYQADVYRKFANLWTEYREKLSS